MTLLTASILEKLWTPRVEKKRCKWPSVQAQVESQEREKDKRRREKEEEWSLKSRDEKMREMVRAKRKSNKEEEYKEAVRLKRSWREWRGGEKRTEEPKEPDKGAKL